MTAVFYDVENLSCLEAFRKAIHKVEHIATRDAGLLQFAYADWGRVEKAAKNLFMDNGISMVQVINGSGYYDSIKNASDIALSVDAIECVYKNNNISTIILVSGDGGYISLVNKLKQIGKRVYAISEENALSSSLRKYVDDVFIIKFEGETKKQLEQKETIDNESNFKKKENTKREFEPYQKAIFAIYRNLEEDDTVENFIHKVFSDKKVIQKIEESGMEFSSILSVNNLFNSFDQNQLIESIIHEVKKKYHFRDNKTNPWFSYIDSISSKLDSSESQKNIFFDNKDILKMFSSRGITVDKKETAELIEFVVLHKNKYLRVFSNPSMFQELLFNDAKKDIELVASTIKILMLLPSEKLLGLSLENYKNTIAGPIAKELNSPSAPVNKQEILHFFGW